MSKYKYKFVKNSLFIFSLNKHKTITNYCFIFYKQIICFYQLMKSTINNIVIKLVTLFMIGVMLMLIANKAYFLHVHKLDNGATITHAHPYDKSNDSDPYKSHQHTNSEFSFFQNLNILFLIIFLTLPLIIIVKKEKVSFKSITETKHTLIDVNSHRGRAPPIS